MRVAVVGAGISGLVSAYVLAKAGVEVVLYEKDDYLGGHAKTVTFDGVDLDLGFMVFNRVSHIFLSPALSPALSLLRAAEKWVDECPRDYRIIKRKYRH
ncbi:hypothetical protein OIU84_021617 [Salix udensis]|uniref:Uncharacterized protein n=1 Tax=Salix udensis TaxID=889485 RepID=A0AAD6PJ76_9ROSI|nr:hypothetical protein OIU84_021617 [Salix udensis]KAJ6430243.1 hypothetical protein OIU84_021617 [Salix udensis]